MSDARASESAAPVEPAAVRGGWRLWSPLQWWVLTLLVLVNISNYLDRGVIAILRALGKV